MSNQQINDRAQTRPGRIRHGAAIGVFLLSGIVILWLSLTDMDEAVFNDFYYVSSTGWDPSILLKPIYWMSFSAFAISSLAMLAIPTARWAPPLAWLLYALSCLDEIEFPGPVYGPRDRIRADFRSVAVGLETYFVDNDSYPELQTDQTTPVSLTTPTSYLSDIPYDYFSPSRPRDRIHYFTNPTRDAWVLYSAGPDRDYDLHPQNLIEIYDPKSEDQSAMLIYAYDPTNGTTSSGDIYRTK